VSDNAAGSGDVAGSGARGTPGPGTVAATRQRQLVGGVLAVAYVLTILLANYAITYWGNAPAFPGGPYTAPVWPGIEAPSGCCSPGSRSPSGISPRNGSAARP
jgi:hypothetical protein